MARVHELGGMIRLGTPEEAEAAKQELAEWRVKRAIERHSEHLTVEGRQRLAEFVLTSD